MVRKRKKVQVDFEEIVDREFEVVNEEDTNVDLIEHVSDRNDNLRFRNADSFVHALRIAKRFGYDINKFFETITKDVRYFKNLTSNTFFVTADKLLYNVFLSYLLIMLKKLDEIENRISKMFDVLIDVQNNKVSKSEIDKARKQIEDLFIQRSLLLRKIQVNFEYFVSKCRYDCNKCVIKRYCQYIKYRQFRTFRKSILDNRKRIIRSILGVVHG